LFGLLHVWFAGPALTFRSGFRQQVLVNCELLEDAGEVRDVFLGLQLLERSDLLPCNEFELLRALQQLGQKLRGHQQ